MNIYNIDEYRTYTVKRDNDQMLLNIKSKYNDTSCIDDDNIPQLLHDAVSDIQDSIDISDDDLINDSVLHLTQLIRDTKDKKKFNDFTEISTLRSILIDLLNFNFDSIVPKSTLEMMAFLSSTNLLEKTEILIEEQSFQYIVDSAIMKYNPDSFVILSNFILENEENAKKCFPIFSPQFIIDTFHNVNDEEFYFNDEFQSQKETYLFNSLLILSSFCNYDVDESAALDILACIKDLIYFNEGNILFLNELFYSLSMFRINCQCCIQKANEVDLFECFESIRCELDSEIIIIIFQYYGDSILQKYQTPKINIEKLINFILSTNEIVSGVAMWLIWTILNNDPNNQSSLFQNFYNPAFFDLIKSIICLNKFVANVKLALLIICFLIENASSDQILTCVSNELIDAILDTNFIETDDQDVVFHIIMALNRLLDYLSAIGKSNFLDVLRSHFENTLLCDLSEEKMQILTNYCPKIMNCFA